MSAMPRLTAMPMAFSNVVAAVETVVQSILNAVLIRILTCALAEKLEKICFRDVVTAAVEVERLAYHLGEISEV